MNYYPAFVIIMMCIIIIIVEQKLKRKIAAVVNHRIKHKNKENKKMKELAEKFIGKNCMVYTIASNTDCIEGNITQVTDNGLLIDHKRNLQAVNLEYVTRIREYPTNSKGKNKKIVF